MKERAERRKAEAAAQRMGEASADFLAILGHEIRSPLGGMVRMLELMREGGPEDAVESAEKLRLLHEASRSLYAMMDELLAWSRTEAGDFVLQVVRVELAPFLRELERLFRPVAASRGVAFEIEVAAGVPEIIWIDPRPLRQIMANLLANAFKFTPEGGVTLAVTGGASVSGQPRELLFTVTDTGMGMEPGAWAWSLHPELQVSFTAGEAGETRGLGWALCRRMAKVMGGSIRVESELGRGTLCVLRIEAGRTDEMD
jgi:signal transduction histidine kinase